MSRLSPEIIDELYKVLEKAHPDYQKLTPMQRHALAWGREGEEKGGEKGIEFESSTLEAVFKKYRHSTPWIAGNAVSAFNGTAVAGQAPIPCCPYTFFPKKDEKTGKKTFPNQVHAGTFRVYKVDGGFDQDQWNKKVASLAVDGWLHLETVISALGEYSKIAPQEPGTGRTWSCIGASKAFEEFAMDFAWEAVFDVLRKPGTDIPDKKKDKKIPLELAEWFFKDNGICFLMMDKISTNKALYDNPPKEVGAAKESTPPNHTIKPSESMASVLSMNFETRSLPTPQGTADTAPPSPSF